MLSDSFQFFIWHESGAAITIVPMGFRGWKFDSNGDRVWGNWAQVHAGVSISSGESNGVLSDLIDNSTDKWIGGEIDFGFTGDLGSNKNPMNVELHRRQQTSVATPTGKALTKTQQSPVLSRSVPDTAVDVVVVQPVE